MRRDVRAYRALTGTRLRYSSYTVELYVGYVRRLRDIALTDHDRYLAGVDFDALERVRERNSDLRIRAGLTQAELGSPMTRSYVSAVERGRAIPSLPSLLLMASRLGVPVAELIGQLEWTWQDPYTADHAEDDPTPCDR